MTVSSDSLIRDLTFQVKKLRESMEEGLQAFVAACESIGDAHAAEVSSAISRGFSGLRKDLKEDEDRAHADRKKILEIIYKHGKKTL